MSITGTALLLTQRLADKEGDVGCVKAEVGQHVVVDFLHHVRPVGVAVVRTALMQQDTLDDTYLLRFLGHLDDAAIGIAAVVLIGQRCPPLSRVISQFLLIQVFVEHLDRTAAHRHGNNPDTHTLGQVLHHSTPEVVGRAKAANRIHQRRHGLVPVARSSLRVSEVTGCQQSETVIDTGLIDIFRLRITLHIRLPETDVDVEIRIHFGIDAKKSGCQQQPDQ